MSTLPPPDGDASRLGRYRLIRLLGRGAMGKVYEALDESLGRRVALKVLLPGLFGDKEILARFRREARAAARLQHPHVVTIYEVGQHGETWFVALELMLGGSLQDRLRSGPLPWREATRALADACRGVRAVHAAGIVHRDLKPGNLLQDADGTVKVADFGLARLLSETVPLTGSGQVLGTPAYMSPEQCQGTPPTERSDIYALGAIWFALLTGRPPYSGNSAMEVMFAHCSQQVPDPRRYAPDLPTACVAILNKAMARTPSARHRDCADLLAELEDVLRTGDHAAESTESTAAVPVVRPSRRRWLTVTLAATGLLGLGVLAVNLLPRSAVQEVRPPAKPRVPDFLAKLPLEGVRLVLTGQPHALAFAPDSSFLAVALDVQQTGVQVWSMETGQKLDHLWAQVPTTSVAISPDGLLVAAGTNATLNEILVREVLSGKERPLPLERAYEVVALAFVPGAPRRLVAALNSDQSCHLRFWDLDNKGHRDGPRQTARFRGLTLSPEGTLATFDEGRMVRFWDATTATQRRELALRGTLFGLALSPGSRTLAVALERKLNAERQVELFHGPQWDVDAHPLDSTDALYRVAFSPSGRQVVSVGGCVRVWGLDSRWSEEISPRDYRLTRLALTAEGEYLAVAGPNDLRLLPLARRCPRWDTTSREEP